MKSPKTVGPAVAVSLVAATVAALAEMNEAAPAGPTTNVVDADVSLVKPPPYTEQFWKRRHSVLPSLSETAHGLGISAERAPSPRHFQQMDANALSYLNLSIHPQESP